MIPGLDVRPAVHEAPIVRVEVNRRLDMTTRIATVIAPPGYGKTTALRQWIDTARSRAEPTVFVPVERSMGVRTRSGGTSSCDSTRRCQALTPNSSRSSRIRRPALTFSARSSAGSSGPTCMRPSSSMTSRALKTGRSSTGWRSSWSGSDDRVRLIVSGRGEPGAPTRGLAVAGWVSHVGDDDLSFSDADARHLARSMGSRLDDAEVAALNRTVEGWPLGLHLGLLAATEPNRRPRRAAPAGARSRRRGGRRPPSGTPSGRWRTRCPFRRRSTSS